MADNATVGLGTAFSWNSQTVAQLTSINGIECSAAMADTSTHQSADNFTTAKPGMLTAGDIQIAGYLDHTDTNGQIAMLTDFNARTLRAWAITYPSSCGAAWGGNGYITNIKIGDADTSGAIPFSATIKPSGKPTLTITTVVGMSAIGFDNDVLMMPSFAIGTFEYVVTITNGQTVTILTPVDATSGEVITITANGVSQVVATGVASTAIALSASAITVITVTISKTGCAPKVYTFRCAVLAA